MTNIFDIWKFVNFITDKYRNGYLSPEEVSQALDTGQNLLWQHYIGERQKGNELALIALKPFNKVATVVASSVGFATAPSLYAETQGIYKTYLGKKLSVRQIIHNEVEYAVNSYLYPIASNPRFIEADGGINVYPQETHTLEWHYLSRPNTPVIGYTNVVNQVVYNPLTSTQLDFAPQYWNEIISLSLPYIGVNLSNQEVSGLEQLFNVNATNGNAND